MQPVAGVNLVSGALQSSLARAQKYNRFLQPKVQKEELLIPDSAVKKKTKSKTFNNFEASLNSNLIENWKSVISQVELLPSSTGYRSLSDELSDKYICLNPRKSRKLKQKKKKLRKLKEKLLPCNLKTKKSAIFQGQSKVCLLGQDDVTPADDDKLISRPFNFENVKSKKVKKDEKFLKKGKKLAKTFKKEVKTDNILKLSTTGSFCSNKEENKSPDVVQLANSQVEVGDLDLNVCDNKVNLASKSEKETQVGNRKIKKREAKLSTPSKKEMGSSENPKFNLNGVNDSISPKNTKICKLPEPKHVLYSREKIKPGWRQKLPHGAGLMNLGNSCYMNSSLQALFHTPAFTNWLLEDSEEHRIKCRENGNGSSCILCAMYLTLKETLNRSNSNTPVRPVYVHNKLKGICKHFFFGRQEDAHEFLRYLLEAMERSYLTAISALRLDNRSKETSPLAQIFGGYIRTEVTCLRCNLISTTFQPLAELQLDIRHHTSLDDAIENHFMKERLENNDYKCERCKTISQATKQYSLEIPPIVLCLQLKRFTLFGSKIAKNIHCNRYLNLSRYLHKSHYNGIRPEIKYRLVALVTHIGSTPNCGHYTAIAETSSGQFYQFDDTIVKPISTQAAVNTDAYLIIYELDRAVTNGSSNSATCSSSSSWSERNGKTYPGKLVLNHNSTKMNGLTHNGKAITSSLCNGVSSSSSSVSCSSNLSNGRSTKDTDAKSSSSMYKGTENEPLRNGLNSVKTEKKSFFGSTRAQLLNGDAKKISFSKPGISLTNSTSLFPRIGHSSSNAGRSDAKEDYSKISKASSKDIVRLVPYQDDESSGSGSKPSSPGLRRSSPPDEIVGGSTKKFKINQHSDRLVGNLNQSTREDSGSSSTMSDEEPSPSCSKQTCSTSNALGFNTYIENPKLKLKSSLSPNGSKDNKNILSASFKEMEELKQIHDGHSDGHSSSSLKLDREESHRRSLSEERDHSLRRNRNPSRSRSRSPSVTSHNDKKANEGVGNKTKAALQMERMNLDNLICGWNGSPSTLSKTIEGERNTHVHKSKEEIEDEDFDRGKTKKIKSRPSTDSFENSGNKFQKYEDQRRLVAQASKVLQEKSLKDPYSMSKEKEHYHQNHHHHHHNNNNHHAHHYHNNSHAATNADSILDGSSINSNMNSNFRNNSNNRQDRSFYDSEKPRSKGHEGDGYRNGSNTGSYSYRHHNSNGTSNNSGSCGNSANRKKGKYDNRFNPYDRGGNSSPSFNKHKNSFGNASRGYRSGHYGHGRGGIDVRKSRFNRSHFNVSNQKSSKYNKDWK